MPSTAPSNPTLLHYQLWVRPQGPHQGWHATLGGAGDTPEMREFDTPLELARFLAQTQNPGKPPGLR